MKVSIITVNYNNREGLERTIRSVVSQTYPYIEYLVIDGNSSDGSVAVIRQQEERISYWVSEPDRGIYPAMNKGIAKASGLYLLFLNSGDELVQPNVVERLVAGEDGTHDLVYGDLMRTFPEGNTDIVRMADFISVEHILHGTLCHPVTLIHSRLFREYGGYDERIRIVADWAFFLKVLVLGNATQIHKEVVVANFYMDGLSSESGNQQKIMEEREKVKALYFSAALQRHLAENHRFRDFYLSRWGSRFRRGLDFLKKILGP